MATAATPQSPAVKAATPAQVHPQSNFDTMLVDIPKHYWFWIGVFLIGLILWCAVVAYTCVSTWDVTNAASWIMR
jgi:hypothetical protein